MQVTISLDDDLVQNVRILAVERNTTLTDLIREYLEKLAAEDPSFRRKQTDCEALERSFDELRFRVGKQDWRRSELYDRV
jgi:hypothetical protein